ncbi:MULTISPECIES: LuxR C-terminal-related transcriptional regulator [Flavobacteriaceae]|uniref:helix-turn-helix and ligand-binding sensor domain-containing protein n=1 Tax=Flavobacteriaceae TaxID=49546 RepID=UPI001492139B|nr:MULTISPECIES: Two component regulator three Y domain-containing protein [Allomuricauda]MDC6365633.1 Two component regulator three Y domain-containing protein [Muricauda sp. AC10]
MRTLKLLAFFLFSCFYFLHGQNLLPPIYNYTLLEYQGGSKNWGLSVNKKGELFVANNKGLLFYNGEKWRLNKLPNNTIIRSVAVQGDNIYTGSYEEFGIWKKDALGDLHYTSLTHLIQEHEFTSEEFWEILPVENAVYFRSFSAIYKYENDKIQVLDPVEVISDFIDYQGEVIVAAGNKGLYKIDGDKIIPLDNQELLHDKTITDIVQYNGGLLLGTKLNGCYFFDGNNATPWETSINEELKLHQLNKLLSLEDGKLILGTIKNGVYVYEPSTNNTKIINRESGLQNNTVLSLLNFKDQLWLGLDNGLARVRLDYPITYYTDYSGVLGMVYDIAWHDNKLYLGSNTGVFYFEKNQLNFVNASQGHVWDLEVVDGDLLCGHNTGTYKIQGNTFNRIADISGGYEIKKVPEQKQLYLQGTYNGLARFERIGQQAWDITRIRGVDFPIKQFCFENPETLWAVHPYKGLYRIHMAKNYDSISHVKAYGAKDSIPSEYNIKIFNIKNQIIFNSEGKWLKYDPILDRIIRFDEFQKFNGKELFFFDDQHFWFVDSDENKEIVHTDLKSDSLLISDTPLRERLAPDSQKMVRINDSTLFVTLNDGFAKIDQSELKNQLINQVLPAPEILALHDETSLSHVSSDDLLIPYNDSRIVTLEVAAPQLMKARYQYQLQGAKEYSGRAENGFIEFQNLPHGQYQFSISTVGIDNRISETSSIAFKISPPWFLSNLMIALYVGLGIGTIFLVRFYNQKKLKRKQHEIELRMQKEQEEKLADLEKEKLAKEIRLKQNELASTTLNIAKKNEMILELKNMLVMNKDKFSNSLRYRSFIKKLNNSIQDTEDWKRFEVNFKELHEDFFERLLKTYPNLTPKDLKLCAYLKMNLSTKEIAPLMAISIRGVEIHRYRLRKKLQIDNSKNLSNFLITF